MLIVRPEGHNIWAARVSGPSGQWRPIVLLASVSRSDLHLGYLAASGYAEDLARGLGEIGRTARGNSFFSRIVMMKRGHGTRGICHGTYLSYSALRALF